MGNQASSVSNESFKSTVSTFFAPNGQPISQTPDVATFVASLKKSVDFHKSLNQVYKTTVSKLPNFTHKINSGEITNALVGVSSNSNSSKTNNLLLLRLLFNLGVFKTKIKDNDSVFVVAHPNFNTVHTQFITNLDKLASQTPVVSQYSSNTVDEESIKKQFDKNLETINKVLSRILFYKYCILLNNYLIHIYAIYAQSQIEVFSSKIIKEKKQQEFVVIQKLLDETIKQTSPSKYNTKLSSSLSTLNEKVVRGGANTNTQNKKILADISNVQKLLLVNFKEFNESNEKTEEFFTKINEIVDNKTKEITEKYLSMESTLVLNQNILTALKSLEYKILENTISPSAENIDTLINNLTENDSEKEVIRNYLQIVSLQSNANNLNSALNSTNSFVNASNTLPNTNSNQNNSVNVNTNNFVNAHSNFNTTNTGSNNPSVKRETNGNSNPKVNASGNSNPKVNASGNSNPKVNASGNSNPTVNASGNSNPNNKNTNINGNTNVKNANGNVKNANGNVKNANGNVKNANSKKLKNTN